jgi:CRISPR-associated endonuclease/helicase Cas3
LSWDGENKFFQTIEGHTVDSLSILNVYIESNEAVIEQFCNRWQLDTQPFLKSLFITVYLHDIGKLTKQFQENISNGQSSQKYPHAYYALSILNGISFPSLIDTPLEKAAILGHHTQLYQSLYTYNEPFGKPFFLEGEIEEFVGKSKEIQSKLFHQQFSFDGLAASVKGPRRFKSLELRGLLNDLIRETASFENKEKLKSIFCYLFSILKLCDDYSSAEFSEFISRYNGASRVFGSIMEEPTKYVPQICVESTYGKVLGQHSPYDYQKEEEGKICGDVPFYGMLYAPCGRGKTETALIWALNAMKKYRRNKIIFAMPTQITSNAMWERFCDMFGLGSTKDERIESGKKYVGLFHGKSFIVLKESKREKGQGDLDDEDLADVRKEDFKGNVFFKPITVTTVDHLIFSIIHGFSQADFAAGNLQNSVIIFDEAHYYEKQTLEHIMTLLELFKKMRIPCLLMSGTLPAFFIEKVKEINSEFKDPYTDYEGLLFEPFKVNFYPKSRIVAEGEVNDEVIKEIVGNYRSGLVQFIILNTVERSKLVYDALVDHLPDAEEGRIILHNSQFTYQDRVTKERDILRKLKRDNIRPFLLIATQVIEISLDISCDIMYTELAPGDALGQRGGRLNRKGATWMSNGLEHVMKVYIPEDLETEDKKSPYIQKLLKKTADNLVNEPYSYLKMKSLCDKAYSDYELSTPTELRKIFKECSLFGYSPYDINFGDEDEGKLIEVRSGQNQKFDVIPWEYYKNDESKLIVENEAKIPMWWYKQNEREQGEARYFEKATKKEKNYWITTIPYSKKRGFSFKTPIVRVPTLEE